MPQLARSPRLCNPATAREKLDRVEVTGTAIKRLAKTALPVQVIGREEITKAGVTTAAELAARISAAANNLTDGGGIGWRLPRPDGLQRSQSARAGVSSTFVAEWPSSNGLCVTRRCCWVDLSNIPAAAIQRVEVLLDGALRALWLGRHRRRHQLITRKDFRGAEASVLAGATREGGVANARRRCPAAAWLRKASNLMAIACLQTTDRSTRPSASSSPR